MSLALALSSLSTTTTELIISQGVFYGLGASVAYTPTIIFMDEWFARRKGLAFGIMWVSIPTLCSLYYHTKKKEGRNRSRRCRTSSCATMASEYVRIPRHLARLGCDPLRACGAPALFCETARAYLGVVQHAHVQPLFRP